MEAWAINIFAEASDSSETSDSFGLKIALKAYGFKILPNLGLKHKNVCGRGGHLLKLVRE